MSKSFASKGQTNNSLKDFQKHEDVIVPEQIGTDPDSLIFPEWSDQEINSEKWVAPTIPLKRKGTLEEPAKHGALPFRDPHSFTLPFTLSCYKWKRPEALFPGKTIVIYKDTSVDKYSDLMANNKHLLNSHIMRSFIASVGTLEYLGFTHPWPIEGITPGYIPTTAGEPWKPWHHIYSLCKAGKGQKHKPQANKYGKYILRIYWLGAWRKVIVDDFIPVDSSDKLLLPTTVPTIAGAMSQLGNDNHSDPESNMIELWPFLLSKALIKIANLTWTEIRDKVDLSVISSLTGWVYQKINTLNMEPNEIWDICTNYVKHTKWINENMPANETQESSPSTEVQPFFLLAQIVDLRAVLPPADIVMGPCFSHIFLMNCIRTTETTEHDLPGWKRFRWNRWATDHCHQNENTPSMKQLQLVDFFTRIKHDKKGILKTDSTATERVHKVGITNSSVGSKREKILKADENVAHKPVPPKAWINFYDIVYLIELLVLFQRPQTTHCHITVTDLAEKFPSKTPSKEEKVKKKIQTMLTVQKRIIWPCKMRHKFNEPLYLFMDSLDLKTITIAFSISGNRKILEQKCLVVHCDLTSLWQNKFSIRERSKMRIVANVMIEKFDWTQNEYQEYIIGLNTVGNKVMMRLLDKGRIVLRVWVRAANSYSLKIFSDTSIEVGRLEDILKLQCQESHRLLQTCYTVGHDFGNLVRAFGTEDYRQALNIFHHSYRPLKFLSKLESSYVEETLFKKMEVFIEEFYPECGDIMYALRILFLKPQYGLNCPRRPSSQLRKKATEEAKEKPQPVFELSWDDDECLSARSVSVTEIEGPSEREMDLAAVKIQSFFRMWYVQRLFQHHKQSDHVYVKVLQHLQNLCKDLFDVQRLSTKFPPLARKVLMSHQDLGRLYHFYDDLTYMVHIDDFEGEESCKTNSWCPIARYIFFINSPRNEPLRVYLVCNLPTYIFKVYDNDTRKECLNSGHSIDASTFASNEKGYTLIASGYSFSNQEKFAFRIRFVTLKRDDAPVLIIKDSKCKLTEISGIYHPNTNSVIAKCIISVSQNVFVTLRFTCSFENVQFYLRCVDERGKLVHEVQGTYILLLPILELQWNDARHDDPKEHSKESTNDKLGNTSSTSIRKRSIGERSSSLGSFGSRSTRQSKKSKRKDVVNSPEDRKYFIEIRVLHGTWPLNPMEWAESDKLRKRNILGPDGKISHVASKINSSTNYDAMTDPKWRFQVIHSQEDHISLIMNNTRDMEIRDIKMQWSKDPKRYSAAKKIRNEYFQSEAFVEKSESYDSFIHFTDSSFSQESSNIKMPFHNDALKSKSSDIFEETPEEYPGRTNKRPLTGSIQRLPPFTFSNLALDHVVEDSYTAWETYSNSQITTHSSVENSTSSEKKKSNPCLQWSDYKMLKNSLDWQIDVQNIENKMAFFNSHHDDQVKQMHDLVEKSLSQKSEMEAHFEELHVEAFEIVNKAYAMRAQFIEKLPRDATAQKQESHKGPKVDEKQTKMKPKGKLSHSKRNSK